MKVLVIVGDRSDPPITATRVRNQCLWTALAKLGVDVRIRGALRERGVVSSGAPLGPPGIDSRYFESRRAGLPVRAWSALTRSYHEWPRIPELAREVDRLCAEWRPDVVHAEEIRSGYYLPAFRRSPCDAVQTCTVHNVESDLLAMTGAGPAGLHLRSLRRYERAVATSCSAVFAYSETDRDRYRALISGANWLTSRGGTDASSASPAPQVEGARLLLVGSLSYSPNVEGLFWFLDRVLPLLPASYAVTVAGSRATPLVRARIAREPRVAFADEPRDLAPHYDGASVCLVPLLKGSGTRGRILEALARERVVVTTPVGAEGLAVARDRGVALAESPEEFSAAIRAWQEDAAGRAAAARLGRRHVAAHHDWAVVASELKTHWEALAGAPGTRRA